MPVSSKITLTDGQPAPVRAQTMGVVIHNNNSFAPRPTGYTVVCFIGNVEPLNALENDIWEKP